MGGMKTRCLCPDVAIREAIDKAEADVAPLYKTVCEQPVKKMRKKRKDWSGTQDDGI
jgi:hypothetical protein